ncbi:hypothetical protein KDL01_34890 [Actinospica durhamensis]|uniref:Uncharacterized protein n=1 Tax=Actinospica durhamensis TaxID=1508375 RepID=A0A941EWZ7_9ACTN|nr:hypothetical protein [Actinospica durhamensis]MBR7838506.1 hypothetical protein [Actinospica durhamensis]
MRVNDETASDHGALELADGLARIARDASGPLGGDPTLGELLEIIGWAFPEGSDAVDGSFATPLRFKAGLKPNKRYAVATASRVAELGDAVFTDTTDLLADAVAGLAADQAPVTPERFSAVLLEALRSGRVPLADVEGAAVARLAIEPPKKSVKLTPGDILAIPAAAGGHHVAVVLIRNRFGTALGLFRGTSRLPRTAAALEAPLPHPVYTDEQPVKTGVWRLIGHDESLLARFPADPEIYHKPRRRPGVDDTGEFGAAETADGTLRFIDADEAQAVGLAEGTYRQTLLSPLLEKYLDERAA